MDARHLLLRRDIRDIKDKVGDLPPEHVGRAPSRTIGSIRIGVEQPTSLKVRASLEHRQATRIADDLRVVVVDDGL